MKVVQMMGRRRSRQKPAKCRMMLPNGQQCKVAEQPMRKEGERTIPAGNPVPEGGDVFDPLAFGVGEKQVARHLQSGVWREHDGPATLVPGRGALQAAVDAVEPQASEAGQPSEDWTNAALREWLTANGVTSGYNSRTGKDDLLALCDAERIRQENQGGADDD